MFIIQIFCVIYIDVAQTDRSEENLCSQTLTFNSQVEGENFSSNDNQRFKNISCFLHCLPIYSEVLVAYKE
jgi:hypothetical protein